MAKQSYININKNRLRDYSAIFSRSVFNDIVNHNDFSFINSIIYRYDYELISNKYLTYIQYLKYIYNCLAKNYRCEYLYKNTIINELLINKHGTKDTIAINEFKVNNSIVDIALFNGVSRAFEIKTELDNERRLKSQLSNYTKIFKECYIVIPEQLITKYTDLIDVSIGIDVLYKERNQLKIENNRKATINTEISPEVLISCLRTNEYKNIVLKKFGSLPDVSCYKMYNSCLEKFFEIPDMELHQMFINEIKSRTNNTSALDKIYKELRQICLSLNINLSTYKELKIKLNNNINIESCIYHI